MSSNCVNSIALSSAIYRVVSGERHVCLPFPAAEIDVHEDSTEILAIAKKSHTYWLAPGEPPVEKHAQQGLPGGRVGRAVALATHANHPTDKSAPSSVETAE